MVYNSPMTIFRVPAVFFALCAFCAALSAAALAQEDARPAEGVLVAQAEAPARYDDPRPITLGDFHRFQDQINARMDRLEDRLKGAIARQAERIDNIYNLLPVAFTTIVALLGLVAALIPWRRKIPQGAPLPSKADNLGAA